MVDAFLTNCRLADGRLVDIGIAGGTMRRYRRERTRRRVRVGQ
jgi:hypothetical protein